MLRNQRSFRDFLETPRGKVYLAAGHYDRTVSAYRQVFSPENLKVMRMEDITTGSVETVSELCGFLGVNPAPLPRRAANRGSSNRTAAIRERLPVVDQLPRGVKAIGSRIINRVLKVGPVSLSEEECAMILDIYADTNRRLDELLGYAAKASSGATK